jgi:hypothetical protein
MAAAMTIVCRIVFGKAKQGVNLGFYLPQFFNTSRKQVAQGIWRKLYAAVTN